MPTFMPYVDDSKNGATDVVSRLLKDRIIILYDDINEVSSQMVVSQLLYLNALDNKTPIYLYINSGGGSVVDGWAITDTMHLIQAPVYTVCMGMCASMGAFILSSGEKGHRYSLPNSEIMIHQVLGGTGYAQCTDIQITAKWIQKTKERLTKQLAENCGKPFEEVLEDCDRDFWMLPEEGIEYGIIDKILTNQTV